MRLLIVEDNINVNQLLTTGLSTEGYIVDSCQDGASALQKVGNDSYPLMILDRMLPDTDGLVICKKLRAEGYRGHILFLTAKDATQDRIEGLRAGADDYICKPFDFAELLARIEALKCSASREYKNREQNVIRNGNLVLSPEDRSACYKGLLVYLTKREFQLLHFLMAHHDQVATREQILEQVWGYSFEPDTKLVEVYIRYLRKKLDVHDEDECASIIESVQDVGYRLRLEQR